MLDSVISSDIEEEDPHSPTKDAIDAEDTDIPQCGMKNNQNFNLVKSCF